MIAKPNDIDFNGDVADLTNPEYDTTDQTI